MHPLCKIPDQSAELQAMGAFINSNEMLIVLVEEIGEVAKALQEGTNLEEELIHVAAVCVRWLEQIKRPAAT